MVAKLENISFKTVLLIFLSLLFYTHFFSYFYWWNTKGPLLIWIFYIFCIIIGLVLNYKSRVKYDSNNVILSLLFFNLIAAACLKLATTSQPLETERMTILMVLSIAQYYLLRGMKAREHDILIGFVLFGICTLIIQILQQTWDIPLFGIINNDEANLGFQRNGIYRFYIGCMLVAVLCGLYYWDKFIRHMNCFNLSLFTLFLISIYLYMVRQNMIVVIAAIAMSSFFIQNKTLKKWIFLSVIMLGSLLTYYYDVLFGELVQSYTDDNFTTDIRFKCIKFVLTQIFDAPLQLIVGHGHDVIEKTWVGRQYYLSDIGMIGMMYYYGLLWGTIYVSTIYKYLFRSYKKIPLYIVLYMFATFISSLFSGPYYDNTTLFVWVCLLYICHLYVDNKKGEYNNLIMAKSEIKR